MYCLTGYDYVRDLLIGLRTNRFTSKMRIESLTSQKLRISGLIMGGSPGELSEELVTQEQQKKGWRMNCDVGEATEELQNEL